MPAIIDENIFRQSPNFKLGRGPFRPIAFVIHSGEGSFSSILSWCLNPKSQVSYHFLISEHGAVYDLIDPKNTAWHAGLAVRPTWPLYYKGMNPNLHTIGIAFAGYAKFGPSCEQIVQMVYLIRSLASKFKIKLDRQSLIGHNEIRQDKTCPGAHLDLDAILWLARLK